MGTLGSRTVDLLQPIVKKIDEQLEKVQEDRTPIIIRTNQPTTLKNNLVLYKHNYRKDWNGKFWMRKHSDNIEITFQRGKVLSFSIEEGHQNDDGASYSIEENVSPMITGIPFEMNDDQIVQHLLEENPSEAFFLYEPLSERTKIYLADPANEPTSALITFMQRRGYKYELVNKNTPQLRIYV